MIYSYSQERRSPGWRWKDPSRGFLAPRKGAHRVGGGKIRFLLPGEALTGSWDFLLPGEALTGLEVERSVSEAERSVSVMIRRAHRAGGGKIRLGDDPSRVDSSPQRLFQLSYGWRWKDPSWDFLLPGEALAGLEAERSVSGISCSQVGDDPSWTMIYSYSHSPGWRWKDPSRGFLEALTGLEVERSVSWDFLLTGEAGWRLEDPSWGFLAALTGRSVSGISCFQERLAGLEAERSVSVMIRLIFLFSGEALTWLEAERSVSAMIRLGP